MPIPAELMKVVGGGAQPGAAGGAPVTSPMATPQKNEGAQAQAQVAISMAMDLIERALPAYGSESPEGMALLDALRKLSKPFGGQREKAQGMIPAELRMLAQQQGMKSPESQGAAAAGAKPGGGAPQQMPMAA